jgi:ATP-dependent Zn protease
MKDYYDNSCYLKSLTQANGDEVIKIETLDTNVYKMTSNTTAFVNVIAHIKSDLLNLDVVYKSKEVTPKINPDKKDKFLIYLLIGIIVFIILLVIIIICIRKRKLRDPSINAVREGNLLNEDNMITNEI